MANKVVPVIIILVVIVAAAVVFLNQRQLPGGGGAETERTITDADKRAIFNPPADNATVAERDNYTALLNRVARETDTITFGPGCAADPFLALVRIGSTVTIKNDDALPHEIQFGNKKIFVEDRSDEGPGETELKIDFDPSVVLLGYGCLDVDLGGNVAGGLYILPPKQEGPPPAGN